MKSRKLMSLMLAILMLVGALSIGAFASAEYRDVASDRWSAEDIAYATEKGYMNGVADGEFNPDGTMERAMIVTVLYRMEGEPKVNFIEKFKDVPAGKYYSNAVIWASTNNITNGATSTTFEPEGKLTREQMATFFARYAEYKHINTDLGADITGYSDYDSISSYAVTALSWANKYGIINGDTETTISPKKAATREQFAAILHRFDSVEFTSEDYRVVYNEPILHSEYTEREYPLVTDADFYVAVNGNDSADGTFEHPFATFARAKEAVRELKKTKTSEIKVAFMAGNYGALDNLTFTSEDSGTEETPITYCAYGDGDVVFNNGITIEKESFKPIDDSDKYLFTEKNYDSIYKVDLSGKIDEITDSNVLFSESNVCYEARYPNKNDDDTDAYFSESTTTVDPKASIELQYMLPKIVEKFRTTDGMKITGHLRTGWLVDTFHVKSYDPETHIITFDFDNYPINNGYTLDMFPLMYEGRTEDTVFFSNLSDQLDHDGEYWFDKETNTLYVYNPNGEYVLANKGTFISIDSADFVKFAGLKFNGTTSTAINTKNASDLTFDRCQIKNVAGKAAIKTSFVFRLNVTNSEFINCAQYCLLVDTLTTYPNIHALVPSGTVIENNLFRTFGMNELWSNAIEISRDIGGKIAHNVFEDGCHGAVRYNESIDLVIEYNIFDALMKNTDDFGAVYTFRQTEFRSNTIRYNLFKNIRISAGAYGVYLDGACGQEVYGNLFYNVGNHAVLLNGGRDNEIHDNVIIDTTADNARDFLAYNSDAYGYIKAVKENPSLTFEEWDEVGVTAALKFASEPQNTNAAVWRERWPQLFKYNFDPANIGDPDCYMTTVNYIKNNFIIGTKIIGVRTYYDMFGVTENNVEFSLSENPLFVNPRIGDYTIRDDANFYNIPIAEIGRY